MSIYGRSRAERIRFRNITIHHTRACVEGLENRRLCSVNVLVHHGDTSNDGENLAETVLTPANVNPTDFGKQFTAKLDAPIYTQPLYVQSQTITRGSATGRHSVVYVGTMHDSVYAIDANTGAVLWKDSFLNISDPTSAGSTTGVTTVPMAAINDGSFGPEFGILATPAIDLKRNELFLNANTQEIRNGVTHIVQRLWGISLADGSEISAPTVIGDTIDTKPYSNYTGYEYVAGAIVNGTGNNAHPTTYPNTDGWLSAPGQAKGAVIAFNAILQMQRTSITLLNGNIYLGFASHGDNGPYYGWILGYSESNLAPTAVFVTTPTYEGIVGDDNTFTAQGGIWSAASAIATDGTNLYVTTGNGAFDASVSNFDASGFPKDHDYGDTLVKISVDTLSSPSDQNGNGWGLKVADYFTPSNELALNQNDLDLGSGGVLLLPNSIHDAAGNPMLVVAGKESRIYLIDRNNLGKFNDAYPQTQTADPRLYDRVLGEYAGDPIDNGDKGIYSTPSYFGKKIYISQNGSNSLVFDLSSFASKTIPPGTGYMPTPVQTGAVFSYPGSTFTISSSGGSNSIVWASRFGSSDLLAFNTSNLATPIYDSAAVSGDRFTNATKFGVPTVANGMVYDITTTGSLVAFGLRSSYLKTSPKFFSAPSSAGFSIISSTDIHLTWKSNSTMNDEFRVDRSTNDSTWAPLAYTSAQTTSFDDSVMQTMKYYYRVAAVSSSNVSGFSNVVVVVPIPAKKSTAAIM